MALLDALVLGLVLGLVYTVLGVGFSLTWGALDVINVSHAAFAILAAYLGYFANQSLGVDPVASLVVIVPVFFLLGVVLYEGVLRVLAERTRRLAFSSLVLTFGLAIALENAMVIGFSADPRLVRTGYTGATLPILGVPVSGGRLVGGAVAVLTLLALYLFLTRTHTGRSVRAVSQNAEGAALSGIDERRVSAITFGIGIASAATAGVAASLFFPFDPSQHYSWLIYVFIVTILGGVGSVTGAAVAGVITGVLFEIGALYVPFVWVDFILFVLLIGLLVARPEGLVEA